MDLRRALIAAVNAFCDELESQPQVGAKTHTRRRPRTAPNVPPPLPEMDEVTRARAIHALQRAGLSAHELITKKPLA